MCLHFPGDFGWKLGRLRPHAAVLRAEVVLGIEHCLGPGPQRGRINGLPFELLDRQPADEGGIVHETLVVGAEEIARHRATGSLVCGAADKQPEIGVDRDGGLGQQTAHRIGRDVGMVLELMPHGELRLMIDAERKGGDDIEADRCDVSSVALQTRRPPEARKHPGGLVFLLFVVALGD